MAREGRSHVRKRKKGCLVGCLTNLMLLLGVILYPEESFSVDFA